MFLSIGRVKPNSVVICAKKRCTIASTSVEQLNMLCTFISEYHNSFLFSIAEWFDDKRTSLVFTTWEWNGLFWRGPRQSGVAFHPNSLSTFDKAGWKWFEVWNSKQNETTSHSHLALSSKHIKYTALCSFQASVGNSDNVKVIDSIVGLKEQNKRSSINTDQIYKSVVSFARNFFKIAIKDERITQFEKNKKQTLVNKIY